jgi:hypothetical protein
LPSKSKALEVVYIYVCMQDDQKSQKIMVLPSADMATYIDQAILSYQFFFLSSYEIALFYKGFQSIFI